MEEFFKQVAKSIVANEGVQKALLEEKWHGVTFEDGPAESYAFRVYFDATSYGLSISNPPDPLVDAYAEVALVQKKQRHEPLHFTVIHDDESGYQDIRRFYNHGDLVKEVRRMQLCCLARQRLELEKQLDRIVACLNLLEKKQKAK